MSECSPGIVSASSKAVKQVQKGVQTCSVSLMHACCVHVRFATPAERISDSSGAVAIGRGAQLQPTAKKCYTPALSKSRGCRIGFGGAIGQARSHSSKQPRRKESNTTPPCAMQQRHLAPSSQKAHQTPRSDTHSTDMHVTE